MEILFDIYFIAILASIIFRGMLFHSREEKWYKTLIPGYNKYVLGKLSDSKKLGILNAVACTLGKLSVIVYMGYELYLIDTYMHYAQIPSNMNSSAQLYLTLPESAVIILDVGYYVMLTLLVIAFICWTLMMRKFSIVNGTSSWYMFAWAIAPAIMYMYYAIIRKTVYIPTKGVLKRSVKYEKV